MERAWKIALAATAPLLLLGCLLAPGKFESSLDVAENGSFTFRYRGEIVLLTSKSFADSMNETSEFTPSCEDDEGAARDCTEADVAEQKKAYDDEQADRLKREAEQSAQMATVLGGLDPNNEATMDEFAERLRREAGWKSVTHRGDGVFDVDYEMSGTLNRDFVFPLFPRLDFIAPFVVVTRRQDNAVLVRAPGFGQSGSTSTVPGTISGGMKPAEGIFTLTTNAAVATNNSEEGPVADGTSQRIVWNVGPLSRTPPEALLRL